MKLFSFKRKIKKFLKNTKDSIKSTWHQWFIKPFLNYLDKKRKQQELQNLIKEFEKKVNTDIDTVKALMYHPDQKVNINIDPDEHQKYLNEKLVEGREHILKFHKYISKTPFMYEPEIVDIHNENLNPNAPTISEIVKRDTKKINDAFNRYEPITRVPSFRKVNVEPNLPLSKVRFNIESDLDDDKSIIEQQQKLYNDLSEKLKTIKDKKR